MILLLSSDRHFACNLGMCNTPLGVSSPLKLHEVKGAFKNGFKQAPPALSAGKSQKNPGNPNVTY